MMYELHTTKSLIFNREITSSKTNRNLFAIYCASIFRKRLRFWVINKSYLKYYLWKLQRSNYKLLVRKIQHHSIYSKAGTDLSSILVSFVRKVVIEIFIISHCLIIFWCCYNLLRNSQVLFICFRLLLFSDEL
jgi:hypothetical protein